MYWDAMTAPPVAKEENSVMSKKLMESTREMPETAASPAGGDHYSIRHTDGYGQKLLNNKGYDELPQIFV